MKKKIDEVTLNDMSNNELLKIIVHTQTIVISSIILVTSILLLGITVSVIANGNIILPNYMKIFISTCTVFMAVVGIIYIVHGEKCISKMIDDIGKVKTENN